MKKIVSVAAGMLFGSSFALGCAARVDVAPPPPPPSVSVQADVSAGGTAGGTAEVDVAPAPETAEPEELVATSEPPELVYEEQTDAPNPGMVWVGGYWQWTGSEWSWYYGGWYGAPEGRIYVSPYYEHVDGHVVYVNGYWGAQGEAPRYYGGDPIVFVAASRPEGYVRGQRVFVARSTGLPPGHRGNYAPHPTGNVRKRAMPTASAPTRPLPHGTPRSQVTHSEPAHAEPGHGEEKSEVKPQAEAHVQPKPEPRNEVKPAAKPAPAARKAPPPRRK